MSYYEEIIKKGYGEFDNQSECEDFIRWAIEEIKILRNKVEELTTTIDLMENDRIV